MEFRVHRRSMKEVRTGVYMMPCDAPTFHEDKDKNRAFYCDCRIRSDVG